MKYISEQSLTNPRFVWMYHLKDLNQRKKSQKKIIAPTHPVFGNSWAEYFIQHYKRNKNNKVKSVIFD